MWNIWELVIFGNLEYLEIWNFGTLELGKLVKNYNLHSPKKNNFIALGGLEKINISNSWSA